MTDALDWDVTDRFISNNGAGPLVARILYVGDGVAHLVRTRKMHGAFSVRFELPISFLKSKSCGWRRVTP